MQLQRARTHAAKIMQIYDHVRNHGVSRDADSVCREAMRVRPEFWGWLLPTALSDPMYPMYLSMYLTLDAYVGNFPQFQWSFLEEPKGMYRQARLVSFASLSEWRAGAPSSLVTTDTTRFVAPQRCRSICLRWRKSQTTGRVIGRERWLFPFTLYSRRRRPRTPEIFIGSLLVLGVRC